TGTVTVATFTDANPGDHSADFTATINWGDTTSSSGTVTYDAGTGSYTVTGSHTYAEEGSFAVAVNIVDVGGATAGVGLTATVSDAALTPASGADPCSTLFPSTGTVTVATFTDANPGDHSADFTATINWGDTTSSSGTVTYDAGTGTYTVTGSHT